MWAQHIPAFAKHFRVIAPDSRGHGRTKNPTDAMTYRMLADDMMGFIQALGLNSPLVCGYSDGGQVVLEMGMHYPGLAKAYVAGGVIYRRTEESFARKKERGWDNPGGVDVERIAQKSPNTIAYLREHQDKFQGDGYWRSYLQQVSFMWLEPMSYSIEELSKIVDPTLVLQGDRDDGNTVEDALHIFRSIRDGELAIAPNSDHMFFLSNPGMFTNLVLDYLLRHKAESKQG
jgi:pimeloyl-ACP methyl ester carboxylesterase